MTENKYFTLEEEIPLLIVQDYVMLPGLQSNIDLYSQNGFNIMDSVKINSVIGVISKKDGEESDIGTAAILTQIVKTTNTNKDDVSTRRTLNVVGICRFKILSYISEDPYFMVEVKQLDGMDSLEIFQNESDYKACSAFVKAFLSENPTIYYRNKSLFDNARLDLKVDMIASLSLTYYEDRLKYLSTLDMRLRLALLRQLTSNDLSRDKMNKKIIILPPIKNVSSKIKPKENDKVSQLRKAIMNAGIPKESLQIVLKDLEKLELTSQYSSEYTVLLSHLELVASLPWSKVAKEHCDIKKVREHLDADHFGMEKVKKRIIEFLAVRQLRRSTKGPIICLVGPPGVGKTSIAKSVATALGRPFCRISLGGVSDPSTIRGHRKTYVGAMPGRVMEALKVAKVKNPVMLIDEVDKLSRGYHGDPGAVLLEIFDPEQNHSFVDNYVNLPFDLSEVLFIATANTLDTISDPLYDRLEVIDANGYTQEEKVQIAKFYLVPKEIKENGLSENSVTLSDEILNEIVEGYTMEAGVRSLQRMIGSVCRAVAVIEADSRSSSTSSEEEEHENGKAVIMNHIITEDFLLKVLGPSMKHSFRRKDQPGVGIGLAWTPSGGKVLIVEATLADGEGNTTLTGQLGSVMKEAAYLGLSWVRQHSSDFGIDSEIMKKKDIHVHYPAGATSKDGPSAGITTLCVLVSCFTGKKLRGDTAMTGEITLSGLILPVGGIKEKILAAHRGGMAYVIIPEWNKKDLEDVPQSVLKSLEVILVSNVEEVLQTAFEETPYVVNKPKVPFISKI